MIAVQDIVDRCLAALDAEGTDRYLWDRDFIYAINYANEWIISLFNKAFADNKLSEESLRELVRIRIWQTSLYSRVAFDSTIVGDDLWSFLAIYTNLTTIPTSPTVATATVESVYMGSVSFRNGTKSAKRLTIEQWNERLRNPFVAGSPLITNNDLIEYAFLNPIDYTGGYSLSNNEFETEISPSVAGELVAIVYLKQPDSPTLVTDDLEYPSSLINLFVDATLNYISYKEADGSVKLYGLSEENVNKIITLMT